MLTAEIAVPVPLAKAWSYEVPAHLADGLALGSRVLCDFGRRQVMGVVVGLKEIDAPPADRELKPIRAVVEMQPILTGELLGFLRDLAAYYFAPIGEVLRLAVPAVERKSVDRLEAEGELAVQGQLSLGEAPAASKKKGALARTKTVASVQELVAVPTPAVEEAGSLRGQAKDLLAFLRAGGPVSVARLEERYSNARAATKRLAELGLIGLEKRDKDVGPTFDSLVARDTPPELTGPQSEAVAAIDGALRAASTAAGRAFLLFGITGSGKTEVYLRAIETCLGEGKGALVMVPEIALTPQLVMRFRARFGDDVAVVHSALSDRARHEMHRRLLAGEVRVAIGARSALFSPVPNLGLVIVDEEHDGSFKQEEGVRYHARDMALLRAHRAGATIVLGSATPSLESWELAKKGKLRLLRLPDRAAKTAVLPHVTVVDLRSVGAGPSGHKLLTLPFHRALDATLAAGEQAIVFLNRRGHSPTVVCGACGTVASCKACSVSLTFHRSYRSRQRTEAVNDLALHPDGRLKCHYCGFDTRLPPACEKCKSPSLFLEGLGTEKLEETLAEAFPGARVGRLDRDVADGKKGAAILAKMRDREIDILVGTQMVTKGHDYPHVTLVGVVNADAALGLPEYRAGERAFSLLVQVAGRAGRHERPGKVFIQTYNPEHPAVRFAQKHDVEGFLEHELVDRREAEYPPWTRLALVRVDAIDLDVAERTATALADRALACREARDGKVEVLGPAPAPLARLRGRYRFRVMLRAKERAPLRAVLAVLDAEMIHGDRRVRTIIDVDPVAML